MRRLLIAGVLLALSGVGVAQGASSGNAPEKILPTGCERHGPEVRHHGHRNPNRKRIAIGFDDGPSADTGAFLDELRRLNIHATFFEIGERVPGHAAVMKRILASGDEIGNHTQHHLNNPGYTEIREAQREIKDATGFTPCVFRPPQGVFNGATVSAARSLDLTTVLWDVDPRDWSYPGIEAIEDNVVSHARPGSIVVMHDGGGLGGQTFDALPVIVAALRHRGYEFVTVSRLLGNTMVYPDQ